MNGLRRPCRVEGAQFKRCRASVMTRSAVLRSYTDLYPDWTAHGALAPDSMAFVQKVT